MIDDIDRIMDVMAEAFDPQWGEAWTRGQLTSSLALPSTRYMLAGPAGIPPKPSEPTAGFNLIRSGPEEEELLLIGVKPHYRGLGIGRHLLAQFVNEARTRCADKAYLEMRENNPAVSLYLAIGFERVGRRKNYYKTPDGSRIDAITFVLDL